MESAPLTTAETHNRQGEQKEMEQKLRNLKLNFQNKEINGYLVLFLAVKTDFVEGHVSLPGIYSYKEHSTACLQTNMSQTFRHMAIM